MIDEYKGHEDVPKNVTHVRFHPSVVEVDNDAFEDREQLRSSTERWIEEDWKFRLLWLLIIAKYQHTFYSHQDWYRSI